MKRRKTGTVLKQRILLQTTKLSCSSIIFLLSFFAFVKSAYDDSVKLIIRPDSSTVVADTRVSFFCRADGNPLPTVVWKKNGQMISDPRYSTKTLPNGLSTLRIEPVRLSDANTSISCTTDNGVGNPVVADAMLTVLSPDNLPAGFPAIELHPVLKSVEQGRTAHVSCRVRGDPRPKVLWLRDLMPVDIRSNNRYSVSTLGNPGALMIQQAKEEDQGKYECVARNALGVMHSKAAHLYVKVRRVPPYFSYKPDRLYKTAPGGALNLTCVAVGYPMPRVFWKKSDDTYLSDPQTAPIGRNVLTLTKIDKTENYTCIAVSKLGNIEAMTTVEVKCKYTLPHAPKNLQISDITSNSVRVSWSPVHIESEPVKKYIIKYRQKSVVTLPTSVFSSSDIENIIGKVVSMHRLFSSQRIVDGKYGEGPYQHKEVPANVTSITLSELEPYQLYEIAVATVNTIGRGRSSMPKEVQTDETEPATAPQKVQARGLSRNSILVRWEPPEKPNGQITVETKSNELMATISDLEMESTYYIHVQAKNAKGLSPMSQLATVIAKQGIPGQPVSLTAKALDSRRVQLIWDKPLHSYNIIGYSIIINSSNGSGRELTLTTPTERHIIDGLLPNTFYSFRVAARSTRGLGAYCEDVTIRTHPNALIGPPRIIYLKPLSSRSMFISWEAPEQQNELIREYVIRWRQVSANSKNDQARLSFSNEEDEEANTPVIDEELAHYWQETVQDATLNSSIIINNLKPNTVYEVNIAAATDTGYKSTTRNEQVQTYEDGS
ncbi:unnamed protein product [Thelazia callipaeda]|uniref:protein-tyrosine-phosphatase n=1 Tax=Thelazia callipaeda TaxID=103827 RepID=A0A0N5CYK9_THECL|nr:unnamed protein product [Thelazia callipaeda]